jgi:hypothetical protein
VAWVLTRGLTTVRNEFDAVWPGRDKASDGSKGDPAHAASVSGHNPDRTGRAEYKDGDSLDEVRAIDVDRDLVPGSAVDWMELVIQYLVRKARAGGYIPFRYIIYKRRIWSRTDGWVTRTYTGANAHNEHAHFSGDYTQTADNWTGSLGLASVRDGGEDMDLTQDNLNDIGLTVANWDYVNGPDVEPAYKVALRSANSATEALNVARRMSLVVDEIARKVDIDPAELESIKQAAYVGAQAGAADAEVIADAVVAKLDQTGLTTGQIDDVKSATKQAYIEVVLQGAQPDPA